MHAELLERGCGQAGGVALGAEDDDLQVVAGHGQPGVGCRIEPPLQDVALDDHGAGDLALRGALCGRPDIDQDGAVPAAAQASGGSSRVSRVRASASTSSMVRAPGGRVIMASSVLPGSEVSSQSRRQAHQLTSARSVRASASPDVVISYRRIAVSGGE